MTKSHTGHERHPAKGPLSRDANAKLCGDVVLVDQATEPVGSLHSLRIGELPKGRVGDWDLKVDPAVRSLIVPPTVVRRFERERAGGRLKSLLSRA